MRNVSLLQSVMQRLSTRGKNSIFGTETLNSNIFTSVNFRVNMKLKETLLLLLRLPFT